MMMSQRTRSGRTSCTFSTASRPFPTVTTSKSSSENVSSMTFWMVMLSSASRIFLPIAAKPPKGTGRALKIDRSPRPVNQLSGFGGCPRVRRGHDLLGALPQSRIDHFHARVAQRARHDFRPAVVSVEPGLGDEDADAMRRRSGAHQNVGGS